jgi:hypothetical protein
VSDIKTSLENQRMANKQRFEDPFCIKIADDKNEGVKIVKMGQDSEGASQEDSSPVRTASGMGRVASKQVNSGARALMRAESNVVIEAKEHEEQSPDIKLKSGR